MTLCHVIDGVMRNALFPRHFTLLRAFSFSRTITSNWGTIQIIERSSMEALIGLYFHFCINKVHEVGGGIVPPVTLLLSYSRCHRLWSVTGCFISDYFSQVVRWLRIERRVRVNIALLHRLSKRENLYNFRSSPGWMEVVNLLKVPRPGLDIL